MVYRLISGQLLVSGGMLTLTNSDTTNTSIPFVNGRFDHASYRVITTYKSGGGLYGLAIVFPFRLPKEPPISPIPSLSTRRANTATVIPTPPR